MKTAIFVLIYAVSAFFGAYFYSALYQDLERAEFARDMAVINNRALVDGLTYALEVRDACIEAFAKCECGAAP